MTTSFTFQQAYDLQATSKGFRCTVVSNHNNVCKLKYDWTADDIAAVKAGTINKKQIIIREIKNCWNAFKAQLDASCEQGYTDDGKGNLSKVVTVQDTSISLPKTTVDQTDLDSGTINNPPPSP